MGAPEWTFVGWPMSVWAVVVAALGVVASTAVAVAAFRASARANSIAMKTRTPAITPQVIPTEWNYRAIWPFHGVPSTIVVDAEILDSNRFRRPPVLPETIIVDHGKPYMSVHVSSVCQRLGISIQPAHVYTPTDKAPVERFFRTIEKVLQELPGYKGSDVAARGQGIEDETVYTIPQLEQIIREWIATVYHLRPHGGLQDPQLPGVRMSPAQKFEQGIARRRARVGALAGSRWSTEV